MGRDGLNGGRELVAAGGTLVTQDEATSVVWDMPGAVAVDGVCSAVVQVERGIYPFFQDEINKN